MNEYLANLYHTALVLLAGALIGAAVMVNTGCKTTGDTNPPAIERYVPLVRGLASVGASQVLRNNPEYVEYFRLAEVALTAAINDKNYDPAKLREVLRERIKNRDVLLAVESALDIYEVALAEMVSRNLDQNIYALPILVALRDGIARSLPQ